MWRIQKQKTSNGTAIAKEKQKRKHLIICISAIYTILSYIIEENCLQTPTPLPLTTNAYCLLYFSYELAPFLFLFVSFSLLLNYTLRDCYYYYFLRCF